MWVLRGTINWKMFYLFIYSFNKELIEGSGLCNRTKGNKNGEKKDNVNLKISQRSVFSNKQFGRLVKCIQRLFCLVFMGKKEHHR